MKKKNKSLLCHQNILPRPYYYIFPFLWKMLSLTLKKRLYECTDSWFLFSSTSALYCTSRRPHHIHQPPCPSSCHFNLNSWPISFTLIMLWVLFSLDLSVPLTSVAAVARGLEVCAVLLSSVPQTYLCRRHPHFNALFPYSLIPILSFSHSMRS